MIPVSDRRSPIYTGTGAVSVYAFGFKIFGEGDIDVVVGVDGVETTLALGTDYTVTVNADQVTFPGGSVNLAVPLPAGDTLVVLGALDYAQTTQLPNGGSYNARVVEQALDKLAVQIQQLREVVGRSVTLAPTSGDASTALPVAQASNVLGWNSTGDALQNYDAGQLGVAVSYANWMTSSFNGTGVLTAFELPTDAGVASNIDLRVNNVPQVPGVNFSYDPGTRTITFLTGAPSVGTGNVVARYGQALPQGVVGVDAVGTTQLVDGAATTAKLADRAATAAKLFAATTARLWGRVSGGSGDVEELTAAQVRTLLALAAIATSGSAADITSGDLAAGRIAAALNAAGSAPLFACRAWVNFNGTGTPAIRASGNVSSITDNGAGDYTVNFTTAMADTNFVMVPSMTYSGTYAVPGTAGQVVSVGAKTTGSQRIYTGNVVAAANAAWNPTDPVEVGLAFFR